MSKRRKKAWRRGKHNTEASNVSFEEMFPSETAGGKYKGVDLPPSELDEGDESRFIKCKQCGFPIDRDIHVPGDEWGKGNIESGVTYPTDSQASGATIGGSTTGGSSTESITAGTMWGQTIDVTKATTLRWASVYCQPSAACSMVAAVYDRREGVLLGMSEERDSIPASLDWLHFRFKHAIEVAKGQAVIVVAQASQDVTARYTTGTVVSNQYAGTYLTAANSTAYIGEAEGDQYGPPARLAWTDWTVSTRNYSVYVNDYLRTLTNKAVMTNDSYQEASGEVGFKSGSNSGCPFCGSPNYE